MNKINQNWIFGNKAWLDFATNPPVTQTPPSPGLQINTWEGCASISDTNGDLLFYTDGRTIWDNQHVARINNLSGHSSSTQSAIIVPDPGNSQQYYIFTADGWSGNNQHLGCILLNISSPVWTQTNLSTHLPSTNGLSATEKVTAFRHKNCTDYWVVTMLQRAPLINDNKDGLGIFRVILVNSMGVSFSADYPLNVNINDLGYLRVSPDGTKIAFANWTNHNIYMFPIDNATGIIDTAQQREFIAPTLAATHPRHPRHTYGVEFSPNSQLLYYSVLGTYGATGAMGDAFVYQIELNQPSAPLQIGLHSNANGDYSLGALQQAMDGTIYIAQDGESWLGIIANPNVIGSGCNLNFSEIDLKPGICRMGLPNLIPNSCEDDHDCGCGCSGCNENAEAQNEELIERAKRKFHTVKSNATCDEPFGASCTQSALNSDLTFEPCFYFHWADGHNDQIEEHDTEVFYITVCNTINDIRYNGFKITKVTLIPDIHPLDKIQIVPDRFICFDCLEPCSCQTREFAMITRANDTAGNYKMEVEYCYESISLASSGNQGKVQFDVEITED